MVIPVTKRLYRSADEKVIAGVGGGIAAYFNIADIYIMPSTGEGFGIVFIEALFFGKPVIAGNLDGSVDALAGGKFGLLVNPDSIEDISKSIVTVVNNQLSFIPDSKQVEDNFGFGNYKSKLEKLFFGDAGLASKQKTVTTATVE